MRYTRKANRRDIIRLCFENAIFAFPFTVIGTMIIVFANAPFIAKLLCYLFIFISIITCIKILKFIFVHLIANKPYEMYVTTFEQTNNDEKNTCSKFKTFNKGHEIGLPDSFKDLTPMQNKLLDEGIYVIGQNIDEYTGIRYYNKESLENKKSIEDNLSRYNKENSMYQPKNETPKDHDPFNIDDCKYNIDKEDPFADFYKKSKK